LTLQAWLNLANAITQRVIGVGRPQDTRLSFKSVRAALMKS
jgi:hypothetical protein